MSLFHKVSLSTFLFVISTASAVAAPLYNLTGISAYLYYDASGSFDNRDLVKMAPGALYNTVIGEGIAKGPSNTTLIVVDVAGPSFANRDVGRLTLKAETPVDQGKGPVKTVIFQQSVNLNTYFQNDATKIRVPFLMYATSSAPVVLTATLTGGKDAKQQTSTLSRTIPFGGGE